LLRLIKSTRSRYQKLKIARNIYRKNVMVTADTGFANQESKDTLQVGYPTFLNPAYEVTGAAIRISFSD
jgi:hypothetical protein